MTSSQINGGRNYGGFLEKCFIFFDVRCTSLAHNLSEDKRAWFAHDSISLGPYVHGCSDTKVSSNFKSLVPNERSWWVEHDLVRTQNEFRWFGRAVHVQSFQSPCTCTARRVLSADLLPFDRANRDLHNAFKFEALAQKEPEIWRFKVSIRYVW